MRASRIATFRAVSRIEEAMIRSVMPRTSAADATPLTFAAPQAGEVLARRIGTRLVRPLTFTIAEAARG